MKYPAQDWAHLYQKPVATADFKRVIDDFVVDEMLGYELSGDGEHSYVHIEKTGLNTAYVAEELAKCYRLPLRQVTYAGRKDKYGRTTQYFGVHHPLHPELDFTQFALKGLRVLSVTKHHKKLKTGHLAGNRFAIILRDVSNCEDVESRLHHIRKSGVPNYYGQQRFGEMHYTDENGLSAIRYGGNLELAKNLIDGKAIKQRNKKNLAISALRSWLFNTLIHTRIERDCFFQPISGDAFMLSGSNSFFIPDSNDDIIAKRLAEGDIHISAALFGRGSLNTQDKAIALEENLFAQYPQICATLSQLGLKQERRAIRLLPSQLKWQWDANNLHVEFILPKGCFATSVLRELCHWGE